MIRLQGDAQQGDYLVNTVGNLSSYNSFNLGVGIVPASFPAASITVYLTGTTTLASIFSDNSGTIKANPFTADQFGHWFFYAAAGRYDIRFSPASPANPPFTPYTWSDFALFDATTFTTTSKTIVFSATPTFDASTGSIFIMTLTGNVTSSTITNPTTGQIIIISLLQDATGNWTFAWPANVVGAQAIGSRLSTRTEATMFYDGTNWNVTSFKIDGLTFPTAADTIIGRASTDTLTGPKTFAQAITFDADGTRDVGSTSLRARNVFLSGTVQTTASTMGITLKKGSGAGNYSSTSVTYADVDATNLSLTVTIPTGWKLAVTASGDVFVSTGAVFVSVSLFDTVPAATLVEQIITPAAVTTSQPFSLNWVIAGDGASHTVKLQYKTSNAADAVNIANSSATLLPTMTFILMPSN